ncbi:DUF4231 domain-containing protein [Streptomyces albipurpureus]|uniref:DUF4231 domain-containing protein n=1 Tax=Streptomyces albipurpureus TaxID=2897419 RepID=A0ABT0UP82_9ACTN|nr:DUF4231 domain-containing protein [Streptomyces sp. CWNU-1]MCM2390269.1 DUF4231 domain-containing protein [Streptomyces sp. CWNU-1]
MTGIPGQTGSIVFRNMDLPALFHHTDAIAIARQREAIGSTRRQLLFLVLGATAAALPTSVKVGDSVQLGGVLAALAYAGVLLLGYRASRHSAKSHWQLNRSAAEFIKSMCWRYSVHGAPFATAGSESDELFITRLDEGLRELTKVGWEDPRTGRTSTVSSELITPPMRQLRAQSFSMRKETYIRDRLIEQRNWYHRSAENSRRATRLWSFSIGLLTLVALFFSLLHTFSLVDSIEVAGVTGVLSTAAASCLAWSEIRRHQPLIAAHSLVKEDLAAMHTAMESSVTAAQWPSAVYETERIVSPQHTDWLARHRS